MIAAAPPPPLPAQPRTDPFAAGPSEAATSTGPRTGQDFTVGKAGPAPGPRTGRETTLGSSGPGPQRFANVLGDIGTLRDTLERTGRLASLSPSLQARVSADLERGRGLRDVTAVPFSTNATSLRRDQAAQLAPAIAARSSPALALVVLGYANEGNRAERSLAVSRQCAESVATALKGRDGVAVPVYSFAMGDGAGLLGTRRDGGSRRFVEVWASDP